MNWLSSPRVRLGLVVNGLYFLSLFSPSQMHTTARRHNYPSEGRAARLRATSPPDYAPLPPQTQPLKADSHYWPESGQLDVYLTRELVVVRRHGHTLLLSPTFTKTSQGPGPPRSALFYFSAFSHEQFYDKDSPFVITADGTELWRYGWGAPGYEKTSSGKALHSAALDGDGQVVETLGHTIPFNIFLEILGSQRVTFELGPDRFELTPEQMEALRDMYRSPSPHSPAAKSGVDYIPYSNSKRKY
jgi:hypothetical protein